MHRITMKIFSRATDVFTLVQNEQRVIVPEHSDRYKNHKSTWLKSIECHRLPKSRKCLKCEMHIKNLISIFNILQVICIPSNYRTFYMSVKSRKCGSPGCWTRTTTSLPSLGACVSGLCWPIHTHISFQYWYEHALVIDLNYIRIIIKLNSQIL